MLTYVFVPLDSNPQFERELIRERTQAGLKSARVRGRKGGRPKGMSKEAMEEAAIASEKVRKFNKRASCFDISTGYGSSEEFRLESDWREVGNIKIPFHLAHYRNGVMIYELHILQKNQNKNSNNSFP